MNSNRPAEPLYELPGHLRPVESVRGTILFLDWSWLRAHGRFEDYAQKLDPAHAQTPVTAATSDWLPVDFLLAHYRALDAIGLTHAEAVDVGRLVGERSHGALLATILRLAGTLGASPWFALGHSHKMWERSWRGGGIAVYRVGDKAARVEPVANPAAVSPFHRASFGGAIAVGLEALAKRVRIEEIPRARTPTSFALAVEWA